METASFVLPFVMPNKHFYIKNMVCSHCAEVLEEKLEDVGFRVQKIELGELELSDSLSSTEYQRLIRVIRANGFDLVSGQGSRTVEQVKQLIIQLVQSNKELDQNLSDYLAEQTHQDYQKLSRLFSGIEGKSIERYFILQKTERAKELIVYGEQTLSEIAFELGYSSQQHFSRQFKKETGLSPSHFNEVKKSKRISIDRV